MTGRRRPYLKSPGLECNAGVREPFTHRPVKRWEQAFIAVDSTDRLSVKIAVDGIAARIAEALGAVAILVWLKQVASDGALP